MSIADDSQTRVAGAADGFSVGYDEQAAKWMIGHQSGKPIAANAAFNVLVFKV
jgi:hypothetical protein